MDNRMIINKDMFYGDGKVIRDAVHGDIFIPNRFLAIIDTPEFQRLRRIKQLSVANMLFPSANHTRFSHSIGTYYIMGKIIDHFDRQFEEMKLKISDEDKDVALVAALLHDIGHGPFSHAFEGINPNLNKKHEQWTVDIIKKESNVNKVLKDKFSFDFPDKVADLIEHQRKSKKEIVNELKKIDLFSVLSSLVSSQLDADRMDYLIRDSLNTGVSFGKIDVYRIISSLRITVNNDKYYICVPEKYLADIEEYLIARYQMHKCVYLHDFKVEMEKVIKKIFKRVFELHGNNYDVYLPENLKMFFTENELNIDNYVKIDDSTLISAFHIWSKSEDNILCGLCRKILDREKFERIKILSESSEDIEKFKNEVNKLLINYKHEIDVWENEYFWIESCSMFSMYKTNKEKILISQSNGTLKDISEVSDIIVKLKDSNNVVNYEHNLTYIDYNMLNDLVDKEYRKKFMGEIMAIIKRYENRNHIEIEKKYYFNDKDVFNKVNNFIKNTNYEYEDKGERNQIDEYYDSDKRILSDKNSTLRIRECDDEYHLTIKNPTSLNALNEKSQSERFEYQIKIKDNDILSEKNFIEEHTCLNVEDINSLNKILTVINKRHTYILHKDKVKFEMVFDEVTYASSNLLKVSECQIEIELKSEYQHKVNLKMLSDMLEKEVDEIIPSNESKFERGLRLTFKKI